MKQKGFGLLKMFRCRRKTKTELDLTVVEASGSMGGMTEKEEEALSMRCLLNFIECLNKHTSPKPLFHELGEVIFKDAPMTVGGFADEMDRLFKAFPDFTIAFDDIVIHSPRSISVKFFATGTHTGIPYGFGPFPEIQPAGAKVQLDAEYVASVSYAASYPHIMCSVSRKQEVYNDGSEWSNHQISC